MTKTLIEYIEEAELAATSNDIEAGDDFVLEINDDVALETYVIESWDDSVLIAADEGALQFLAQYSQQITEDINEAEYQGRKVALGKPMAGDVKKSKVYVRKPNGSVVKVNFGDKKLSIKKHIPGRRKSFRARHNCSNPGPRWKARYWSCRAW
jgi:hypothetical protein